MPEVASQEIVLDAEKPSDVSQTEIMEFLRTKNPRFDAERFANDILTIRLAEPTDPFDDPILPVIVNGTLMPIPRGVEIKIKRKYVEVLARAREVRYEQRAVNPLAPEQIELHGRVVHKYPFEVIKDPHPDGKKWLESIRNEPL